ncbi:hypothetical protein [Chryseobacterium gambrini]|uniref:hypothetical protein n=1 Tax=Chryseobacterium gambrini TaxID=373672 RepID=UPI0022F3956D|nr:hypothetical protein [Chryseobacterium gambrini]WBX95925.1 hypothetical protein PE065_13690 [Chryseobacterium gambrini]
MKFILQYFKDYPTHVWQDFYDAYLATPCEELKNLYKPAKANIKPSITKLQGKLSEPNENGKNLVKDQNGVYSSPDLPVGTDLQITIKVGNEYYGSIHTHPYPGAVPMFSWTDVFTLYYFYQKVYEENKHDVVIIIVCKDDNGVNQTYALKIDNPDMLYDAIVQDIQNNPKIKNNSLQSEILDKMDEDLTDLYAKNGTNREKPFLERFANFGISLYKADEDLTTWNKLVLENGIVTPIPCN